MWLGFPVDTQCTGNEESAQGWMGREAGSVFDHLPKSNPSENLFGALVSVTVAIN
jgi:hypothetical protein